MPGPNSPNAPGNATPSYMAPPSNGFVQTALNVNQPTVVKATPGSVLMMNVLVAGSVGAIYDCASSAAATTSNEIAVIPAAAGPVELNFPCLVGIVVKPGANQVVSLSYV